MYHVHLCNAAVKEMHNDNAISVTRISKNTEKHDYILNWWEVLIFRLQVILYYILYLRIKSCYLISINDEYEEILIL